MRNQSPGTNLPHLFYEYHKQGNTQQPKLMEEGCKNKLNGNLIKISVENLPQTQAKPPSQLGKLQWSPVVQGLLMTKKGLLSLETKSRDYHSVNWSEAFYHSVNWSEYPWVQYQYPHYHAPPKNTYCPILICKSSASQASIYLSEVTPSLASEQREGRQLITSQSRHYVSVLHEHMKGLGSTQKVFSGWPKWLTLPKATISKETETFCSSEAGALSSLQYQTPVHVFPKV